jgi:hypothetical protein
MDKYGYGPAQSSTICPQIQYHVGGQIENARRLPRNVQGTCLRTFPENLLKDSLPIILSTQRHNSRIFMNFESVEHHATSATIKDI